MFLPVAFVWGKAERLTFPVAGRPADEEEQAEWVSVSVAGAREVTSSFLGHNGRAIVQGGHDQPSIPAALASSSTLLLALGSISARFRSISTIESTRGEEEGKPALERGSWAPRIGENGKGREGRKIHLGFPQREKVALFTKALTAFCRP